MAWFSDGKRLLAVAIILSVALGAWMFRYENVNAAWHRNRITGAVCAFHEECWIESMF